MFHHVFFRVTGFINTHAHTNVLSYRLHCSTNTTATNNNSNSNDWCQEVCRLMHVVIFAYDQAFSSWSYSNFVPGPCPYEIGLHCHDGKYSAIVSLYFAFVKLTCFYYFETLRRSCFIFCLNSRTHSPHFLLHNITAVAPKNCASIVRCGFRERETFGGENTALNKVLFLICLSLQETLWALCCKVSASCLPLFLTHSFSSPFLSPFFPPPAVWVIEFIPYGRWTTSGHPPNSLLNTHRVASSAPMLHLWQLWVTMLFLNPR